MEPTPRATGIAVGTAGAVFVAAFVSGVTLGPPTAGLPTRLSSSVLLAALAFLVVVGLRWFSTERV
jgi:hypothetical protein